MKCLRGADSILRNFTGLVLPGRDVAAVWRKVDDLAEAADALDYGGEEEALARLEDHDIAMRGQIRICEYLSDRVHSHVPTRRQKRRESHRQTWRESERRHSQNFSLEVALHVILAQIPHRGLQDLVHGQVSKERLSNVKAIRRTKTL